MKKVFVVLIVGFLLLSMIAVVKADDVFSFNNFVNKYKLYRSASCDVQGTKSCNSELSWQGNKMKFRFELPSLAGLSNNLKFTLDVVYYTNYGKPQDALMEVKVGGIKQEFVVDSTGTYSVIIPKSSFKAGKNDIALVGKNINSGYGHYTRTVVLGYVELENI